MFLFVFSQQNNLSPWVCFLLLLCATLLMLPPVPAKADLPGLQVRSWEELRWQGVVRQTTEHNCGPASLATLLLIAGGPKLSPAALYPPDQPVSLSVLRSLLAAYGFTAYGLRMNWTGLNQYLTDFPWPVIAHVLLPTPHFTLVTGLRFNHVLTRDPSLGLTTWERSDWTGIWSGAALVVMSGPRSARATVPEEEALSYRLQLLFTGQLPAGGRWQF